MSQLRLALFIAGMLAVVLIPFVLFEGRFQQISDQALTGTHPAPYTAAAILLLLVADVLLPVPSSVVSAAAGALLGFSFGCAANFIGMTLGSSLGYLLGRYCRPFVQRWLLSGEEMERIARSYDVLGIWIIALSRPVPVLAETVTLTGGVVRTAFAPFLLISMLANLIVAAAYAYAGALARQSDSLLLAVFVALLIPGVARWLYGRFRPPAAG